MNNWQIIGHSCYRWLEFKENIEGVIELSSLKFERCPFCGDPLDYNHKSYVKIELDTLHYQKKRLDRWVENLKKDYRVIDVTDVFTGRNIYLILVETVEDGDKFAMQLQNYPEVKMAYDKRHERIVLN